jgi:hypothetical protein
MTIETRCLAIGESPSAAAPSPLSPFFPEGMLGFYCDGEIRARVFCKEEKILNRTRKEVKEGEGVPQPFLLKVGVPRP